MSRRSPAPGGAAWVQPSQRSLRSRSPRPLGVPARFSATGVPPSVSPSPTIAVSAGQLPCAGFRGDEAARACARSRRAPWKSSGEPPTGFVRRRKVGDGTRRLYSELGDGLLRAASLSRRSLESPKELDQFLDSQLTELYFAGATVPRACNLFYALPWHRDVRPVHLPLSLWTLKGFGRERPDSTRDGVTWGEALLISNAPLKHPEGGGVPPRCVCSLPSIRHVPAAWPFHEASCGSRPPAYPCQEFYLF